MKAQRILSIICILLLSNDLLGQVDSIYIGHGIDKLKPGSTTTKEALKIMNRKGAVVSKLKRGKTDTYLGGTHFYATVHYPYLGLELEFHDRLFNSNILLIKIGGAKYKLTLKTISTRQVNKGKSAAIVGVTQINELEQLLGPAQFKNKEGNIFTYIMGGKRISFHFNSDQLLEEIMILNSQRT